MIVAVAVAIAVVARDLERVEMKLLLIESSSFNRVGVDINTSCCPLDGYFYLTIESLSVE